MGGNLVLKMAGDWATLRRRSFAALRGLPHPRSRRVRRRPRSPGESPLPTEFRSAFKVPHEAKSPFISRPIPARRAGPRAHRARIRRCHHRAMLRLCRMRADYYQRASALRVIIGLRSPLSSSRPRTILVPFEAFLGPQIAANPHIQFFTPEFGGHCASFPVPSGEKNATGPKRASSNLRGVLRETNAEANLNSPASQTHPVKSAL